MTVYLIHGLHSWLHCAQGAYLIFTCDIKLGGDLLVTAADFNETEMIQGKFLKRVPDNYTFPGSPLVIFFHY